MCCWFVEMLGKAILILVFTNILAIRAWDQSDLEMFDLMEEMNTDFYDFLNVPNVSNVPLFMPTYGRRLLQQISSVLIASCPWICIRIKILTTQMLVLNSASCL